MLSELFRIPVEWGGVPLWGAGLLLAIWAVASVAALVASVARHGWSAETISLVPLLLLMGAAIYFAPLFFPSGLPVRGYGLMLLVGGGSGIALAVYRARQAGLGDDVIMSLAFWLFISGILGARAFYVIEYWEERFAGQGLGQTLVEVLNFPQGGLVVYGALIGAALAFVVFTRRHRLPLLAMADLIAPSLAIGLAFGRIGCLLNGCCYGGATDLPWAVTFPLDSPPYQDQVVLGEMHGLRLATGADSRPMVARVEAGTAAATAGLVPGDVVISLQGKRVDNLQQAERQIGEAFLARRPLVVERASGDTVMLPAPAPPPRSRPVHPTQIYSAINAGLLAWLTWSFYPFRRRDGEVIALLMTIYPVTRFLLEIIRIDESAVFGTGLSISQNLSVIFLLGAAGLWWYLSRQPRQVAWPQPAGAFRT